MIPARLNSSRLPRKVLADIAGKPMLWHVYHRCLQARRLESVHIATDTPEVADLARSWGATVWMTPLECASGTERIVAIADRLDCDVAINVQGDQPLIDPAAIDRLVEEFARTDPRPPVITPVYPLRDRRIFDPNVVKVLRRRDGYALYFSRSTVPYVRDADAEAWLEATTFWGHVGIYGYRIDVLRNYAALPPSPLEAAEKLEQLRLLEAGLDIYTFLAEGEHLSVDTPADLERARLLLQANSAIAR